MFLTRARRIALLAGPNDHLIGPNYQATGRISSDNSAAFFHNADAERMPEKNKDPTFEDLNPRTLFREFAAECMELAQTTPEKRALYLKMASVWHQMAQRWEKKASPSVAP